jgi:diguanylate cyclase (GGDEF)-like protein
MRRIPGRSQAPASIGEEGRPAASAPVGVRLTRPAVRTRLPAPGDLLSVAQLVCLVGFAVATALPQPQALREALFTTVVTATAVSCGVAAVGDRRRPTGLAAWLLLAVAHLGVAAAGVWSGIVDGWSTAVPAGPPAAWHLAYYPSVLLASALLVRDRTPRWLPSMWWDAAVVALGAGAVATTMLWLLRPEGGFTADPRSGLLAPVANAVLLTAILSVSSLAGSGLGPGQWWIPAGLCVLALADAARLNAVISPDGRAAADLALLTGYTLVGLGTRASGASRRTEQRRGWTTDRRQVSAEAGPEARLARGAILPTAVTALAIAVVTWALLGGPVPRGAALLGLACLVLALARSVSGWAPHRTTTDANTDALTGLANRQALSRALAGDDADGGATRGWAGWTDQVSLLLVDIDRFKDINEALGHDTGDQVLAEVGSRFQSVLREGQLLARLGGDEFAVLLPGADEQAARRIATLLRQALHDPISSTWTGDDSTRTGDDSTWTGSDSVRTGSVQTRLHVQASAGIATCELRRGRPADLLRQADVAVSRAKAAGTGVEVFQPDRDRIDTTRLRRTDELRAALERGDLEVHLQPQVDLATGAVVGVEALARWRHPQDGVLLPASFLPLAARTGLLRPVAALVLDRATAACARWWNLGHRVPVSINLTADDLRDPALPDLLESNLVTHGLPASSICLEITEDAVIADPAAASVLLQRWRAAGVGVALDDFGTGYSSLAYLRDLPLDELKLDRAFVSDLRNRTTATIVRHTVAMAHALRLRVVGEGVEDASDARTLADSGCDIGQGLYFGDAMDLEGFLAHLDTHRP